MRLRTEGNLVRIKKRNTQAGESTTPIVAHYGENVSNNSISQNSDSVNQNSENSQKLHQLRDTRQQRDRGAREYLKRRYPMPSLVDKEILQRSSDSQVSSLLNKKFLSNLPFRGLYMPKNSNEIVGQGNTQKALPNTLPR